MTLDEFEKIEKAQRAVLDEIIKKIREELELKDQLKSLNAVYDNFNKRLEILTDLADNNRFNEKEYNRWCDAYDKIKEEFDQFSEMRWTVMKQIKEKLDNLKI